MEQEMDTDYRCVISPPVEFTLHSMEWFVRYEVDEFGMYTIVDSGPVPQPVEYEHFI